MLIIPKTINAWEIEADWGREYDCASYGCDDICRCGKIVDVTINSNKFPQFLDNFSDSTQMLDKALDFWFFKRHYTKLGYDPLIEGGYYGEELNEFEVLANTELLAKVDQFNSLSSYAEKIKFLLTEEYGYVLPEVEKVENWTMEPVLLADIIQSSNTKLSSDQVEVYRSIYRLNLYTSTEDFQKNISHLAPLCLRKGKSYAIVDGRHRFQALIEPFENKIPAQKGKKKVHVPFYAIYAFVICPSETSK